MLACATQYKSASKSALVSRYLPSVFVRASPQIENDTEGMLSTLVTQNECVLVSSSCARVVLEKENRALPQRQSYSHDLSCSHDRNQGETDPVIELPGS
jgi:hypothetical protein